MGTEGLHPELLRIRQEYEELYEAVTAGHVSEEEAGDLLRNITAVDSDGAVWSFDPHTGNLVRALPGLPQQQASPDLFVPARGRGPAASGSQPPIPSLSGDDYAPSSGPSSGPSSDSWDEESSAPETGRSFSRDGSEGRRSRGFRFDPRLARPVAVVAIGAALSAFFLLSGREPSGGETAVPAPGPVVEAPDPTFDRPPAPDFPSSPTLLEPLPQVLLDESGAQRRLEREAVERLFAGLVAAETDVVSGSGESWARAYALPIFGASAAGWRVSVSEWVIAPDGRDRLTLVLTHPGFPSELSWWAFIEPESGFWVFSEIRPLPAG